MKKEEIGQIYYLTKEKRMWERAYRDECNKSNIKGQDLSGMPKGNNTENNGPGNALRKVEILENIARLNTAIDKQVSEIVKYISTIEDSVDRQIVWLRAKELKSWNSVAHSIGGYMTADSVRMRYNRLIEKDMNK